MKYPMTVTHAHMRTHTCCLVLDFKTFCTEREEIPITTYQDFYYSQIG